MDSLHELHLMGLSCEVETTALFSVNIMLWCGIQVRDIWPDGAELLKFLKEVDHLGLTGEIRYFSLSFQTFASLLHEKIQKNM